MEDLDVVMGIEAFEEFISLMKEEKLNTLDEEILIRNLLSLSNNQAEIFLMGIFENNTPEYLLSIYGEDITSVLLGYNISYNIKKRFSELYEDRYIDLDDSFGSL